MRIAPKISIYVSIIFLILVLLVGCDPYIENALSVTSESKNTFVLDVPNSFLNTSDAMSRSIIELGSDTTRVWVAVKNSEGELIPSTDTTSGITELTKGDTKWSGTVHLVSGAATGNLTFSLWAQSKTTNEHTYIGSTTWTYGAATTGISIATSAVTSEYEIGSTGPGGGLVFYDKGNDDDGWQYLEAAPEDFTYTWDGIPIATSDFQIDDDGNVVKNQTTVSSCTPTNGTGEYQTMIPWAEVHPITGPRKKQETVSRTKKS